MGVLRWITGLLDRLFVVVGAFLGSQIPQFIQQYSQQLAGHVEELNYLLEQLHQVASYSNKTLEQYINKFLNNSDPDFLHQGEFMQTMLSRWQDLSIALQSLLESSIWTRPYAFIAHFNYEIAKSAFYSFQPSISLTLEGVCYTGVGLLIGYLSYRILTQFIKMGYTKIIWIFKRLFYLKTHLPT